MVYVWDSTRPGQPLEYLQYPHKKRGLISVCEFSNESLLATGSYDGSVVIQDPNAPKSDFSLKGAKLGGVSGLKFSSCGRFIYVGSRKQDDVYRWDIRQPKQPLVKYFRNAQPTNQRLEFDVSSQGRLATGSADGGVLVYDVDAQASGTRINQYNQAVNGIGFSPSGAYLAYSVGERGSSTSSSSEEEEDDISTSSFSGVQGSKLGGGRGNREEIERRVDDEEVDLFVVSMKGLMQG